MVESKFLIKRLEVVAITPIVEAFAAANWPKPVSLFESYFQEQSQMKRVVWVTWVNNAVAGYVTLKWHSGYPPFLAAGIPEIVDLNVLPSFRKLGIGSELLEVAECEARTKSELIGIGVGLYGGTDGGYGSAQRLYVKRGYIPDGKGVTYNGQYVVPGKSYPLDDDLVLWFTKKLR